MFYVFVIYNDIDWKFRFFQIVISDTKGFENNKKFLIIYIIVEFSNLKYIRIKYD